MQTFGIVLSLMLAAIAVFQILLVLGQPLGKAAWGGKHRILPTKLRLASVVSVIFIIFSIMVTLSAVGIIDLFNPSFTRGYLWFLTVYSGIGVVMNALSRSKIERLWAPYIAVMFILSLIILLE